MPEVRTGESAQGTTEVASTNAAVHERVIEFFAYETIGAAITHAAPIPCIDVDGYRIMFPSEEERTRFLNMSEDEKYDYLKKALEAQNE